MTARRLADGHLELRVSTADRLVTIVAPLAVCVTLVALIAEALAAQPPAA